jgi:hypothetical protein
MRPRGYLAVDGLHTRISALSDPGGWRFGIASIGVRGSSGTARAASGRRSGTLAARSRGDLSEPWQFRGQNPGGARSAGRLAAADGAATDRDDRASGSRVPCPEQGAGGEFRGRRSRRTWVRDQCHRGCQRGAAVGVVATWRSGGRHRSRLSRGAADPPAPRGGVRRRVRRGPASPSDAKSGGRGRGARPAARSPDSPAGDRSRHLADRGSPADRAAARAMSRRRHRDPRRWRPRPGDARSRSRSAWCRPLHRQPAQVGRGAARHRVPVVGSGGPGSRPSQRDQPLLRRRVRPGVRLAGHPRSPRRRRSTISAVLDGTGSVATIASSAAGATRCWWSDGGSRR